MAVLKKHGAELLRLKRTGNPTDERREYMREFADERVYMSDGSILAKHSWRSLDNYLHAGHFTIAGKVRSELTPKQISEMYIKKGWTVEFITTLSADRPIIQGALDKNAQAFGAGTSNQSQFL